MTADRSDCEAGGAAPALGRRVQPAAPAPTLAWAEADSRTNSPGEGKKLLSDSEALPAKPQRSIRAGLTLAVPSVAHAHRYQRTTAFDSATVKTKFQKRKEKLIKFLKPPYFTLSMIVIMGYRWVQKKTYNILTTFYVGIAAGTPKLTWVKLLGTAAYILYGVRARAVRAARARAAGVVAGRVVARAVAAAHLRRRARHHHPPRAQRGCRGRCGVGAGARAAVVARGDAVGGRRGGGRAGRGRAAAARARRGRLGRRVRAAHLAHRQLVPQIRPHPTVVVPASQRGSTGVVRVVVGAEAGEHGGGLIRVSRARLARFPRAVLVRAAGDARLAAEPRGVGGARAGRARGRAARVPSVHWREQRQAPRVGAARVVGGAAAGGGRARRRLLHALLRAALDGAHCALTPPHKADITLTGNLNYKCNSSFATPSAVRRISCFVRNLHVYLRIMTLI